MQALLDLSEKRNWIDDFECTRSAVLILHHSIEKNAGKATMTTTTKAGRQPPGFSLELAGVAGGLLVGLVGRPCTGWCGAETCADSAASFWSSSAFEVLAAVDADVCLNVEEGGNGDGVLHGAKTFVGIGPIIAIASLQTRIE